MSEQKEKQPWPKYIEAPVRIYEAVCVGVPIQVGLMLAERFIARQLGFEEVPIPILMVPAGAVALPIVLAITNRPRN